MVHIGAVMVKKHLKKHTPFVCFNLTFYYDGHTLFYCLFLAQGGLFADVKKPSKSSKKAKPVAAVPQDSEGIMVNGL